MTDIEKDSSRVLAQQLDVSRDIHRERFLQFEMTFLQLANLSLGRITHALPGLINQLLGYEGHRRTPKAGSTGAIACLYLPTQYTDDVEKLLVNEPEWAAPVLWRSEFRNILALYVRKEIIDFETACACMAQAEQLLASNEFDVDSISVLSLTKEPSCSAYGCEFISLAKSLNCKLITSDKKLKTAFPQIAMDAGTYISENSNTGISSRRDGRRPV